VAPPFTTGASTFGFNAGGAPAFGSSVGLSGNPWAPKPTLTTMFTQPTLSQPLSVAPFAPLNMAGAGVGSGGVFAPSLTSGYSFGLASHGWAIWRGRMVMMVVVVVMIMVMMMGHDTPPEDGAGLGWG
jgi:hypothetical protein